jgi:hypothetical protein
VKSLNDRPAEGDPGVGKRAVGGRCQSGRARPKLDPSGSVPYRRAGAIAAAAPALWYQSGASTGGSGFHATGVMQAVPARH